MTRSRGVADYGYYPPVNSNILINPSFTVNQRGDVIDHNTSTYGPDRWGVSGISTTGGTMSQSTTTIDPATGINKLLVKHRNATDSAFIYQRVEAVNLLGLYGEEMTLSFSFSNTGAPNLPNVRIYTWNAAGDYSIIHEAVPTSLGNSRWTCTFTLSTDDGTIPKTTDVGLGVTIYSNENKTDPAPNEWSVWETKLEAGSVATPFIARSHGEELYLCYRYYQSIFFQATTPLPATRRNTNEIGMPLALYAEMRTNPTFLAIRASGADPTFTLKGDGQNESFTNPSISYGSGYALIYKGGLTNTVNNESAYVVSVQSGYLQFDAEL